MKSIEDRVADLQNRLEELESAHAKALILIRELQRDAARTKETTQQAVNGLHHDILLIYKNVRVPNVTINLAARYIIE